MSDRNFVIIVRERRTFFATLEDARNAAQDYFDRTGNIVGIQAVQG